MRLLKLFFAAVTAALLAGCATRVDNNYRTPLDFADHLVASGVPVTQVQRLNPTPFRASEGIAIEIDGSEIGVYKYNQETAVFKGQLDRIRKAGRTYVSGMPLPAVVHGSFMFIGLEKNKKKAAIEAAIETFN